MLLTSNLDSFEYKGQTYEKNTGKNNIVIYRKKGKSKAKSKAKSKK